MADFATPQLIVTKAGMNAANAANPYGPWVHITSFKIGSAYGYDPQKIPDDTDIDGDLLYNGVPTQYKNLGNGVLDIVLRIPADAGPFQFGEVGIYNQDSNGDEVLFAKAVFAEPQIKYSSLGTNVASSFTLHALVKLEQSIAVFKIDTLSNNAILEVDRWSDVLLPSLSSDPDTPLLLVRELNAAGHSSLLHYSVPGREAWTIGTNYTFILNTTVKNSTAYTVRVPAADVPDQFVSNQDTKYVIEIGNRNDPYRLCVSLVKQGQDAVFTIHDAPLSDLPAPNTKVTVYQSDDYSISALATNSILGIGRAGPGLQINTPGVYETHGLLHAVQGAGRILTAADDLMSTALSSGVYDIIGTGGSRPLNMPPGTFARGQLYRTNTTLTGDGNYSILDTVYLYNPNSGLPTSPYSRSDNMAWFKIYAGSVWSPWRSMLGDQAGSSGGSLVYLGATTDMSGTFTQDLETIYFSQANNVDGGNDVYAYINGTRVYWSHFGLDNGQSQVSGAISGRAGQTWRVLTYAGPYGSAALLVYSRK